jgi:hypothetical protein
VAFDVDVGVVGDVEDDLDDLAAGELEAVGRRRRFPTRLGDGG